jgi:metal-responsive CopG/Arc/MetJ family transcriptional regulator
MFKKQQKIKIGLSFDPPVLKALDEFAKRHFKNNRSKAADYIFKKSPEN